MTWFRLPRIVRFALVLGSALPFVALFGLLVGAALWIVAWIVLAFPLLRRPGEPFREYVVRTCMWDRAYDRFREEGQ